MCVSVYEGVNVCMCVQLVHIIRFAVKFHCRMYNVSVRVIMILATVFDSKSWSDTCGRIL